MNYMAPDFPPKSAERVLSRRVRRALNSTRLLALAEPYGDHFEVPDQAPDAFRDDLLLLANDVADELWPGGNGMLNSVAAENFANATADFYWAEACEIMRKNFMGRHKAVQSLRRLGQTAIDRMSPTELAGVEEMVDHIRGLLMFASPSKE
jgi:hypothetical protein